MRTAHTAGAVLAVSAPRSSAPNRRLDRESEREWHDCPYCYRKTPTFVLTEIERADPPVVAQRLRCCWECGAGIEVLR